MVKAMVVMVAGHRTVDFDACYAGDAQEGCTWWDAISCEAFKINREPTALLGSQWHSTACRPRGRHNRHTCGMAACA